MIQHSPQEQKQESQLARMRLIATGLLVVMALVFVGARLLQSRFGWLSFVAAFAEAAMVGALADWFAVTALFRAPLGLPIPHTAIIPRNKDRIGASIANFLENNFITPEVISVELAAIDFAGVAGSWLAIPQNSRTVARQAALLVPAVLRMIEDEDVGRFLQIHAGSLLATVRVGPVVAEILSGLIAEQQHQQLFDHLIRMAGTALDHNKQLIRQKIDERSPRWMPKTIDERFFNGLMEELQDFLEEMSLPDSDWRLQFRGALEELIGRLRSSPEMEAKLAGLIAHAVQHPLLRSWSENIWHDVKLRLLTDVCTEDSQAVARIEQALVACGGALTHNPQVRDKLNGWISAVATQMLVARRTDIAALVRRVIQSWDAETVSRKFEMYVGPDLQYIRINGTIVGGLVGLGLHVISLAL